MRERSRACLCACVRVRERAAEFAQALACVKDKEGDCARMPVLAKLVYSLQALKQFLACVAGSMRSINQHLAPEWERRPI